MDDRPSSDANVESQRMPFGEHLEELRSCIIRALVGLAISTVVSLIFAKEILKIILRPAIVVLKAHGERPELLALSPEAPFIIYLKVGLFTGILVSAPWILYQLWMFVSTGLYAHERKFARRFAPISIGLFVSGVTFMFYIVLPIVLSFFATFNQGFDLPNPEMTFFERALLPKGHTTAAPIAVSPDLKIPLLDTDPADPAVGTMWINNQDRTLNVQLPDGTYISPLKPAARGRAVSSQYGLQFFVSLVFSLAIGFGAAFELPVVVVFLAVSGIVTPAEMAGARRYVVLGIVIAAAILTPPDLISQVLLAVPMLVLFESGLIVARILQRRSAA